MTPITGGSEKQVAYAESIRGQFLEGVEAQIGFARRPGWEDGLPRLAASRAAARVNGSARFWLDRSRHVRSAFEQVIRDLLGDRD